jgi:hypothetical protein
MTDHVNRRLRLLQDQGPIRDRKSQRIVYSTGRTEWSLLEIEIPDGRIRTLGASGGTSWFPNWAPSGTHYLYATNSFRAMDD